MLFWYFAGKTMKYEQQLACKMSFIKLYNMIKIKFNEIYLESEKFVSVTKK